MVDQADDQLNAIFAALADPTRRAIVRSLAAGEKSVSELAAPFDMSLPAVSKHVQVLMRGGIVEQRRQGRERRCRLVAAPMFEAAHWIVAYAHFWQGQLDSLAAHVGGPAPEE